MKLAKKLLALGFFGGDNGLQLSTPDLYLANLSTSQITAYWGEGADSYSADIATDSGFTNIVGSYNGANTSNAFTGLSADTQYYVRVKATKSGFTDSEYSSTNAFTFYNVVAAYLYPGMPNIITGTEVNDYGSTTNRLIDYAKSVINLSASNLVTNAADKAAINYSDRLIPYSLYSGSGSRYSEVATQWDLGTGAFTIIINKFRVNSTPISSWVLRDKAALNTGVRIDNLTTMQLAIASSFRALTFPSALVVGTYYDLIIDCDGSNIRVSIDGGLTWSATNTRPVGSLVFGRANSTAIFNYTGLLFASSKLTSLQATRWVEWYKNQAFTKTTTDFSLPLQSLPSTFISDPVNGYIDDFTGQLVIKGFGYSLSKQLFSWGDKYLLGLNAQTGSPNFDDQYLVFGDTSTNKVYTPINLGHFNEILSDVHKAGTYYPINNQLFQLQYNQHYDYLDGNNLRVRKYWKDFNMLDIQQLPQAKVATDMFVGACNYPQPDSIGNTLAMYVQRFDSTVNACPTIQVALSDDGFQSFYDYYPVADTVNTNWFYPHVVYSKDKSYSVILFEHTVTGPTVFRGVLALYTTDFITYRNLANTWSKNVKTSGAVTLTELYTNAAIIDARALTSTTLSHFYCTDSDMIYGVVGNGNDTGYELCYQTIGGSLTKKTINFGADSIVTGTKIATTGTFQFAYHRTPIVAIYDGGTTFRVIAAQVNGGNWLPTVYQTTDNGDNWTKLGTVDGIDNTKQHTEFEISHNIHFNSGKAVFACSCHLTATTSKAFVKSIADLI